MTQNVCKKMTNMRYADNNDNNDKNGNNNNDNNNNNKNAIYNSKQ